MAKVSQRIKKIHEKIESRPYKAFEALQLLKETATAKFIETAEAHISLRLDTKYADQQLRTTVILPKGTGKKIRIGVIAQGEKVNESLAAGADLAGSDERIQDILKGLMPSPKSGTVTSDVKGAIEEFKKGKLEYRADKSGIVHLPFGKTDFSLEDLLANLEVVQESIDKNRPSGAKGRYWKSFYICSTMGPSILIDVNNFRDKIFS